MATSQTEVESEAIELSGESFETFCNDITGMFGVEMSCEVKEQTTASVKDLKKNYKGLAAIYSVKAEGAINGTFHLIFDQDGLFTLGGTIMMLPENQILENKKRGAANDAENSRDAISEAGNLLVGAWDRVFRDNLEGHGHFVQSKAFVGKPWTKSEEAIGLGKDEEVIHIPCEMTIGSYPAFECGVIFPKSVFNDLPEAETDEDEEEAEEVKEETKEDVKEEAKEDVKEEVKEEVKEDAKEESKEEVKEEAEEEAKEDAEEKVEEVKSDDSPQPVSGTIAKMAESAAVLPGEGIHASLGVCAQDIMETEVVWGSSDDSVQDSLSKMQQKDAGYLLVGSDGVLEGVVSKSDITGAVSPYLKPVFAKWRRPLDDATLQIKVKWIMSRPVRTVKPDTSLAVIMENMREFGGRCLPVVADDGKVQGLITVFDIFKILLSNHPTISTEGKVPQSPPLV